MKQNAYNLMFIAYLSIATFILVISNTRQTSAPQDEPNKKVEHTFNDLLDAIEWVESKGDSNAIGDGGDAVGAYQIHKIFVRDVNRILSKEKYIYSDRADRDKSREMASIYLTHYGGTFEEMARKHNGGPQGHKKEATKSYWLKVKARMEGVQ